MRTDLSAKNKLRQNRLTRCKSVGWLVAHFETRYRSGSQIIGSMHIELSTTEPVVTDMATKKLIHWTMLHLQFHEGPFSLPQAEKRPQLDQLQAWIIHF